MSAAGPPLVPSRPAGGLMLHPLVLGSVAVLVLNDHLLKAAVGSWWTGKLSDVAGLVFFPVLLLAAVELAGAAAGRSWRPGRRWLVLAAVLTAAGFAAVEVLSWADALYEQVLGAVQAPVRVLLGGPPGPVVATADLSDLLALPAVLLPVVVLGPRLRPPAAPLPR